MPRAPAARAAVTTASSCSGRSESPGRIGAIPTPTSMPASASARIARRRLAGGAVPGSVVRQTRSSSVGRETYTLTGTSRAAAWRTSMSRTISGPRVTMESGVPDAASSADARTREPEPRFSRLVRIGRGAECDFVVLPGRARELAPEHLGDIWLDANRPAVPIVGRAICALLEVPDVTERAAVDAPHVRVERPRKGIPRTAVNADLQGSIR